MYILSSVTMDCVRACYRLWKEARQEHHTPDGRFIPEAVIKPSALRASSELEECWREQVFLVHETYNADKSAAHHMVNTPVLFLSLYV